VSVNNECAITKRRRERHEQHRSGVMSDTQGGLGLVRARDYPAARRNDRGASVSREVAAAACCNTAVEHLPAMHSIFGDADRSSRTRA